MSFYELSSLSLMEANKEETPNTQNIEDENETSLGKRKIDLNGKTEDEREVKRIAFFSQKPQEEERAKREEDIEMTEEDTERDDPGGNTDKIMEDTVIEEDNVVDFNGFF